MEKKYEIAIIGLGYVGLPLAIAFSKFHSVVGYDIDEQRISELKNNIDRNTDKTLISSSVDYSCSVDDIKNANIYIVTVPTPLMEDNTPDLSFLKDATSMIAPYLQKGDIVIYESTVYPGVTQEICVPILEKISSLVFNTDFFCGYSPERISPGNEQHSLNNVIKVTSGSTPEIAQEIDRLYHRIVKAGTYQAPSIRIAEAAKVVENIQRDVNIALMNELAIIFDKMDIDTSEVLKTAKTKWNFIDFKPGLVGGHCISVDPFYLSYQSEKLGFTPDLILTARQINDGVASYIVIKTKKILEEYDKNIKGSEVLILGYTFKENCGDIRNSKVSKIVSGLEQIGANVSIYDPYLVDNAYNNLKKNPLKSDKGYDVIIVAVAHNEFKNYTSRDFTHISKGKLVLLDIKGLYSYSTWKL